jgi:hypothetical protein
MKLDEDDKQFFREFGMCAFLVLGFIVVFGSVLVALFGTK